MAIYNFRGFVSTLDYARAHNLMFAFFAIVTSINVWAADLVVIPSAPVLADSEIVSDQLKLQTDQVGLVAGQFRVDESGAATYTIPITTPLSTAGVAPIVTLNYSSLSGYGPLGRGWSLNAVSGISRCRQSILHDANAEPITWSNKDRFCLDGQRLLVEDGDVYGAVGAQYRTEIDSQRWVTSVGGTAGHPDYFEVLAKDGSITRYGAPGETDSELSGRMGGSKATNKILTWSISRFEDSVGNPISYHYADSSAHYRLVEIAYSYGASVLSGMSIYFNYEDEGSIASTNYVTGYQFNNIGRLNNIEVVNTRAGATLRRYEFTYHWNMLASVTECVQGQCLPETTFEYGFNDKSTKSSKSHFVGGDKMLKYQIFDPDGDGRQSIVWVEQDGGSQKLMHTTGSDTNGNLAVSYVDSFPLSHSDPLSIIDIDVFDYNADGRQDLAVFNKSAPSSQLWRVYLSSPNQAGTWQLKPTNTFLPTANRSIRFADLNGDGLEDLFYLDGGSKINIHYLMRDESQSATSAQFYKFSNQPSSITIPGSNVKATGVRPAGDFNGDGQVDLIISMDNSSMTYTEQDRNLSWRHKKTAFIFNDGRLKHFRELETDQAYFPVDINADGLTDLVYSRGNFGGNEITASWYFALNTGNGFSAATLIKGQIEEAEPKFVDQNGDGFIDFLWSTSDSLYARNWNPVEKRFFEQDLPLAGYFSPYENQGNRDRYPFTILDFDGDGVWDVTFYGKGDFDSAPSVVVKLRNGAVNEGKLTRITNSLGKITEIEYGPLNHSGHYSSIQSVNSSSSTNQSCIPGSSDPDGRPICHEVEVNTFSVANFYRQMNDPFSVYLGKTLGGIASAPVLEVVSPAPIVTAVHTSAPIKDDPNNKKGVAYFYHQSRAQAGGRGSLGFKKLTTIDLDTGVSTTTSYRQDWPFIGQPESTVVTSSSGFVISRAESKYTMSGYEDEAASFWQSQVQNAAVSGTAILGPVSPYLNAQSDKSSKLNNNGASFGALFKELKTDIVQDEYGNATAIVAYALEGNEVVGVTTTINDYGIDDWQKRFGRLKQTSVRKQRFGEYVAGQADVTKSVEFTYYGLGGDCVNETNAELHGMLCSEKVLSNTGTTLTTRHYYDQFGNTVYTKVTDNNGEERLSSYSEYDASGRFVERMYEIFPSVPINDSSPSSLYNSFSGGEVVKTKEVNGRDDYGNPIRTTSFIDAQGSGNTVVSIAATTVFGKHYFSSDSTGSYSIKLASKQTNTHCPSGAKFHTTSLAAGGGISYECFDLLGRIIRSASQGFNASTWIYQDTDYDQFGHASRVSKPYKSGGSIYWTEYEYDLLDRIVKTTEHINGQREVSSVIYDGFLATYVNPKSQQRSELYNVYGDVIKAEDSSGTAIYKYDALGNLVDLIDPHQNVTHIEYDDLGRKVSMNDPDKGHWEYRYNAYGEIVCQADALAQITVSQYDIRGRLSQRRDYNAGGNCDDPDSFGTLANNTNWLYDTSANTLGKPHTILDAQTVHFQTFKYDSLGRIATKGVYVPDGPDNGWHYSKTVYDQFNRVLIHYDFAREGNEFDKNATLRRYNSRGYLSKIQDAYSSLVYYEVLDMDAFGNVTESILGNGVEQSDSYYQDTGLANTFSTHHVLNGNLLKNKVYWDEVGNVDYREITRNGVTERENFGYDGLNRLEQYQVGNQTPTVVSYDNIGNISSKSDVQNGATYDYSSSAAGPHAVNRIGSVNYFYNANGSLISDGRGRTFTYTAFDKVSTVKQSNRKVHYLYGVDRGRYMRIDEDVSTGSKDYTYYLDGVEKIHYSNGTVKWKRNIGGVAHITQIISGSSVSSERISYFHKDHLGSINAITDEVGTIVEEFAFDPWGARRASTSVNMSRTQVLNTWWRKSGRTTLRGFTGHEMVDGVDIIHMNGRIYDAHIGRFLQADPIIQEPTLIGNLNRYSYVLNNPLNATDPSGYVLNKLVRSFIGTMSHIFGAEVTYVFGATVAGAIGNAFGVAYWDYQFNRAMGATSSQAFRSSATAFVTASISYQIGGSGWEGYQKVFAHAVVGGVAAEVQGGDFITGFFASGVTKGFSETGGMESIPGEGIVGVMARTAIAATIGGTVSEMTGGKFANGARTAALQHLFNYETERASAAQKERTWSSYLPGTEAGDDAAQYWAGRVVNSEWHEDPAARAGLFFSVLWTDETAASTAFTLGTAGTGVIGSRAVDFLTKGYGFKLGRAEFWYKLPKLNGRTYFSYRFKDGTSLRFQRGNWGKQSQPWYKQEYFKLPGKTNKHWPWQR